MAGAGAAPGSHRPPGGTVRRSLTAALLTAAAAGLLPAGISSALGARVDITEINVRGLDVSLVLSVPRAASARPLPPGSVVVVEDGVNRELRVEPVPADQQPVVALVDDTAPERLLTAQLAAVRELLRQLPAAVPTAFGTAGERPRLLTPLTRDRRPALSALSTVAASPGPRRSRDAVVAGLRTLPEGAAGAVVLVTAGRDLASRAGILELSAALGRSTSALYVVVAGDSETAGASFPGRRDTTVLAAPERDDLLPVVADIAASVPGRYRASYRTSGPGNHLITLVVTTPAGRVETTDVVEVAGSGARPGERAERRNLRLVIGGGILAALGVLLIALGLRRGRRQPAG
jgi:hypothetical protein